MNDENKHYLERAAELRRVAAKTRDLATRDVLIKAANAYERLAEWKPSRPGEKNKPE